MLECLKEKCSTLSSYYEKNTKVSLVFLRGNRGLGKSSVAEKFLSGRLNILQMSAYMKDEPYLSPVLSAIKNYNPDLEYDFGQGGLLYSENVTRSILKIVTCNPLIIYCPYLAEYPEELVIYLVQMLGTLSKRDDIEKVFVIFCIDTDAKEYRQNSEHIQELYSLNVTEEFINFSPFTDVEMKNELEIKLGNKCAISENEKEYIIKASSGNIRLLQIIINYLKQNNTLYIEDGFYKCKKLEAGSLADVLENYIEHRYNRLSERLKIILQKSGVLGKNFSVSELKSTFNVIEADSVLSNIEKISQLVKLDNTYERKYSFENDEVYIYVKNKTPMEDRSKWAGLIALYYETLYYSELEEKIKNTYDLAHKAAYFYQKSGNYEKAFSFYVCAAKGCFSDLNYHQTLIHINELKKIRAYYKAQEILCIKIDTMEAECYEHMGLYKKALDKYTDNIQEYELNPYYDSAYNMYKIAFCTYYISDVYKAKNITDNLLSSLDSSNRTDDLYYKVLSLAATLYKETGLVELSRKMFNKILKECSRKKLEREYYTQLRKSDYCLDINFTIPLLLQAKNYFRRVVDYKEYAKTALNLGVDYLYMGNPNNALKHLKDALDSFSSYGSIDILYVYNAYGVYMAMYEQDYKEALSFFQKAYFDEMNGYKKVSVGLNQAMCYMKIGEYDKCLELIDKTADLKERQMNKNVAHYHRSVFIAYAFYYYSQSNFKESLKEFEKCKDYDIKPGQLYLLAHIASEIEHKLGNLSPCIYAPYYDISHDNLFDKYVEEKLMFHTLRFVE